MSSIVDVVAREILELLMQPGWPADFDAFNEGGGA